HCHLPHHMMNNRMDLLSQRAIQTAGPTQAEAMSQMASIAQSAPFRPGEHSPIAANASSVPGFPQDAFMEMGMDDAVAKPETYGLPTNWSAQMMGMMTLVRVLPDAEYEEMMERIRGATTNEKMKDDPGQ
ncbi:MAG: hypothetical protein ACRD51_08620, partial [Candidatus Acidiferrum sp.]